MKSEIEQAFVCMKIERDATSKVSKIQFKNTDGTFGGYKNVQLLTDPIENIADGLELVSTDQIIDALARLVGFRDRLHLIPDFGEMEQDLNGMPVVQEIDLTCNSCHHQWVAGASGFEPVQQCPKCKCNTFADLSNLVWIGPASPVLQALWGRLPAPEETKVTLRDGAKTTNLARKVELRHKLGYTVQYEATNSGIHLSILRDRRPPVNVFVDPRSTTVSISESEGGKAR